MYIFSRPFGSADAVKIRPIHLSNSKRCNGLATTTMHEYCFVGADGEPISLFAMPKRQQMLRLADYLPQDMKTWSTKYIYCVS